MEFSILGSSSGLPEKDKNLSSVIVELNQASILLDCGEGIAQRLLELDKGANYPDIIAISHLHPDHVSGFFMLIQSLYLQKRSKPLKVFMPERIQEFKEILPMFYTFYEKLSFKIEYLEIEQIEREYPFIKIRKNDHLDNYQNLIKTHNLANKMNSYSFRIEENNKSLVYTSDINSTDSIADLLQNTDYCIIDAIHPKANDFFKLEPNVNKKIVLTHGRQDEIDEIVKIKNKFEYAVEKKIYSL